jgi:hypothetical protein
VLRQPNGITTPKKAPDTAEKDPEKTTVCALKMALLRPFLGENY